MDKSEFASKIKGLSKQIAQYEADNTLKTEEATKNALIMPLFAALGYNVFDPTEFVPEYTADFGSKKGERVDYAVVLNDEVQILVESKELSADLTKHDSQLFRYFTATKAKFGILTNGNDYRFYTDLEEPNVMDNTPFLSISLRNVKDSQITELFKFTKDNFDVDRITDSASDLKYVGLSEEYLTQQMTKPDDDFIKLVLSHIYSGMKTQQIIEQFTPVIIKGFNQIIAEQVNSKLSHALNQTVAESDPEPDDTDTAPEENDDGIVTTPDEIEAYTVAKVVMKDVVSPDRILYRDNKNYFNVLIDDNIRKWVIRIFFRSNRNFIVLHDENHTELEFENPVEIYNYADRINAIAAQYAE